MGRFLWFQPWRKMAGQPGGNAGGLFSDQLDSVDADVRKAGGCDKKFL